MHGPEKSRPSMKQAGLLNLKKLLKKIKTKIKIFGNPVRVSSLPPLQYFFLENCYPGVFGVAAHESVINFSIWGICTNINFRLFYLKFNYICSVFARNPWIWKTSFCMWHLWHKDFLPPPDIIFSCLFALNRAFWDNQTTCCRDTGRLFFLFRMKIPQI